MLSMKWTCTVYTMYTYHAFAKASQTFRNHGITTSFHRKGVRLPTSYSLKGLPFNLRLTQNSQILLQHASCLIYNLMTQLVSPVTHSNRAHYCSHCCYQWTHWHPNGKELYCRAINLCGQHLQNGCLTCSSS